MASDAVRAVVAAQAREVIEGRARYSDFIDVLPEGYDQDQLLAELVDLIEHEEQPHRVREIISYLLR